MPLGSPISEHDKIALEIVGLRFDLRTLYLDAKNKTLMMKRTLDNSVTAAGRFEYLQKVLFVYINMNGHLFQVVLN